eukprot:tig00000215_g18584.t1
MAKRRAKRARTEGPSSRASSSSTAGPSNSSVEAGASSAGAAESGGSGSGAGEATAVNHFERLPDELVQRIFSELEATEAYEICQLWSLDRRSGALVGCRQLVVGRGPRGPASTSTRTHTREDVQACLDGAYSLTEMLAALASAPVPLESVHLSGSWKNWPATATQRQLGITATLSLEDVALDFLTALHPAPVRSLQLDDEELTSAFIAAAVPGCHPRLRELRLPRRAINFEQTAKLVEVWPRLRELSCWLKDGRALRNLAALPLEDLRVSFDSNVDLEGALEALDADCVRKLRIPMPFRASSRLLSSILRLRNLEELWISVDHSSGDALTGLGALQKLRSLELHLNRRKASVLSEKIAAAAAGKIWVDVGFFGGLTSGNAAEMDSLIDAGAIAIKAFMVHSGMDDFPEATEADLAAALPTLARRNVPLVVHAELKRPGSEPYKFSDPRSYKEYVASRPEQMESDAVDLILRLTRSANASAAEAGHAAPRVHIAHVSYAGVLDAVRRARQAGLSVTAETCPHYLVFDSEMIQDGQTAFKCAPPIRAAANRELLWASLLEGTLNAVVSDHSPCPPQLKLLTEGDFEKAWGGISSLQLGLSIMWTEGRHRKVTIKDLADWMSTAPARIVGLAGRKGLLAPGYDADIVIWNPEDAFYVGGPGARLFHRHGVTPYFGNALEGRVVATVVRGIPVYLNGTHLAQ